MPRLDTKATAQALRQALRSTFPGTTFSVTMSRGTGYGWLHVTWTNGPTDTAVRQVTRRFESARYDSAAERYRQTENTDYSCSGVNTSRSITTDVIARGLAAVRTNEAGERFIRAEGVQVWQATEWEATEQVAFRWAQSLDLTTSCL